MRKLTPAERLRALTRDDKWFLSCGDGVIWAPPFPQWLHRAGFWDEAHVYHYPFAPLFTVALVKGDGTEVQLKLSRRRWQPARMSVHWTTSTGVGLLEERYALPRGTFVSSWSLDGDVAWSNSSLCECHLVAFSIQPGEMTSRTERAAGAQAVRWYRILRDDSNSELEVVASLSMYLERLSDARAPAVRLAALRSEGSVVQPIWQHTPFAEGWNGGLSGVRNGDVHLDGVSDAGLAYIGVDVPLSSVGVRTVGFAMVLGAAGGVGPGGPGGPGVVSGPRSLESNPGPAWERFFEGFPRFECSDIYLSRYYDYRLYGLRLNLLAAHNGNIRHPTVAEGIGYFHVPIAYSAPCHMWETRWCREPEIARGSILNFLDCQKDDGSLHGRIYPNHLSGTNFYHANWGDAVLAVDRVHSDSRFLARAYDGLTRYAHWLDTSRDKEQSGMYDVVNHYETGQEYMSRYQVVAEDADRKGWESKMRLKGIDVTVYTYQLKRALAEIAERLGSSEEVVTWHRGADRIGRAILDDMWDHETGFFYDVDPETMRCTGVKAAVCFYPLLTDLLDDHHVRCLLEHLKNSAEFATPFPVPSSSADDPLFSAHAIWKGKRHNCPWNGRVWPMINSHIIEGLLRQWHAGRREVEDYAGELLTKFIRMMFHECDPKRPNCYEHYNPFTGRPSIYRGVDDYQHSWVLDLLIRCVAGIEPTARGLFVDPLPMELDEVTLEAALIRGRDVAATRRGDLITVSVDGTRYETEIGSPLTIPLD